MASVRSALSSEMRVRRAAASKPAWLIWAKGLVVVMVAFLGSGRGIWCAATIQF